VNAESARTAGKRQESSAGIARLERNHCMAYVPAYKNDIFVSYAHVDNIPLSGIEKGWVETFIDNLSTKLAQKLGRTDLFKLWDDRLLAQNAPLTPEILDALKGSATFGLGRLPRLSGVTVVPARKERVLRSCQVEKPQQ
jgi:hypothetical protein